MRLVIEIPDDLHTRFKSETSARGVTQADIVRNLLESWLKKPGTASEPPRTPAKDAEPPLNRDELLRRVNRGR